MSENKSNKGQAGLYGDLDNPEDDFITFELVKVPMQDFVSSMRKSAVHAWKDAKALHNKVHSEVTGFISKARSQTNERLRSVGITNPAMAVQVGAIGTGALVGLFLARKRSTFRRILYPTLAGGSVWAAFYLSSASNRRDTWRKIKDIEDGYMDNISKYYRGTDKSKDTKSR